MARGHTAKGRRRSSLLGVMPSGPKLLKGKDHGDPFSVSGADVGGIGDRWVEPFLAANRQAFKRLDLKEEVHTYPSLRLSITPGSRIGAVPLVSPSTRRVSAGILIEPRFDWSGLGAVFSAIGFSVPPTLGGHQLVPGSTREVPAWVIAGPVLERIAGLLLHPRRGFVERREVRSSPRGGVQWTKWATCMCPRAQLTAFPCRFSEPDDDPVLAANVRWTLARLASELRTVATTQPGRILMRRASELMVAIGPGAELRPAGWSLRPDASDWIRQATEAMTWVAEERGLGGARVLDGLAWDLSVDRVWEAWVARFAADLAGPLGMVASPFDSTRRVLRWEGTTQSMGSLAPDIQLRGSDRTIWIDAKYKMHLYHLARRGWVGLSDQMRAEHRADLHQALAYATLADVSTVDTLLVYPLLSPALRPVSTIATVTSGRRRVRLILAALPFGFRSPHQRDEHVQRFRELLAA
jgi:hypothetical protein